LSAAFGAVLLAFPSAPLALAKAPSHPRMGMFVLWARDAAGADLGGRETNLRAWEARLKLPPSSLLAVDFYADHTWASLREFAWLPRYWAQRNPRRKLVWSIPLTFEKTPLREVAAGTHDADFAAAAAAIAASQPDAVLRIGWEMNGDWMAWAAKGVEADYVAAYRRVAAIFRTASPGFVFDWCANVGLQNSPPDLAYPGDDVVDTIGLDVYDVPQPPDARRRWREDIAEGPFGLDWLDSFSALHGKRMSLAEWGVGLRGAPDNPYFVEKMSDWIAAHADRIAFQAYFDAPPHQLEGGAFPQSLRVFEKRFSAGGRS
jgi:hypothetical protein